MHTFIYIKGKDRALINILELAVAQFTLGDSLYNSYFWLMSLERERALKETQNNSSDGFASEICKSGLK